MERLSVGVIGLGTQGRIHAESYSMLEEAKLLAVCDINKEKAEVVAKELNVPKIYVDYREMLKDPEIQGLSVATPDFIHRDAVVHSLRAGKHVLCEKPMATRLEDADAMIEAWKGSDSKFMICFENRWNFPFRKAKELIEKGKIGQPIYIYTRLCAPRTVPLKMLRWAEKSSPVFFLSVHQLDMCRWLLDSEISEIVANGCSGFLKKKGVDTLDAAQSLITFENSVKSIVETNWILPEGFPHGYDFEFRIIGSDGSLEINTTHQTIKLSTDESHIYPEMFRFMSINGYPYGFVPGAIRHFVHCVLKDKQPLTTPYDGRASTEAALAILESINKKKIVRLR